MKTWGTIAAIAIVVLFVPIPGWNGLTIWRHLVQGIPVGKTAVIGASVGGGLTIGRST